MNDRFRPRFWLIGLLACGFMFGSALGGCGGGDDGGGTDQTDETVEAVVDSIAGPPGIQFASPEGRFRIIWPSGCEQVRTRLQHEEPDTTLITQAHVFCDRAGRENEGCAVTVYFQLRATDGSPATPQDVIEIIKNGMSRMGVQIRSQQQHTRGSLTGIQVHCEEQAGAGTVWFEGYLQEGTGYVIYAWKLYGSLFEDNEIQRFFQSFELLE